MRTKEPEVMKCRFGLIEAIMLFSSGRVLTRAVRDLLGKKRLDVVTGQRLLKAPSHEEGRTLKEFLAAYGVPLEVCEDINHASHVRERVSATTLGISLGALE